MKVNGPFDQYGKKITGNMNNAILPKIENYEGLTAEDRQKLEQQHLREVEIESARERLASKYISPINRNYKDPTLYNLKPSDPETGIRRPLVRVAIPKSINNSVLVTSHLPEAKSGNNKSSTPKVKTLSIKLPINVSLATVLKNIYEHMYEYYFHKRPNFGSKKEDAAAKQVIQGLIDANMKNISTIVTTKNISNTERIESLKGAVNKMKQNPLPSYIKPNIILTPINAQTKQNSKMNHEISTKKPNQSMTKGAETDKKVFGVKSAMTSTLNQDGQVKGSDQQTLAKETDLYNKLTYKQEQKELNQNKITEKSNEVSTNKFGSNNNQLDENKTDYKDQELIPEVEDETDGITRSNVGSHEDDWVKYRGSIDSYLGTLQNLQEKNELHRHKEAVKPFLNIPLKLISEEHARRRSNFRFDQEPATNKKSNNPLEYNIPRIPNPLLFPNSALSSAIKSDSYSSFTNQPNQRLIKGPSLFDVTNGQTLQEFNKAAQEYAKLRFKDAKENPFTKITNIASALQKDGIKGSTSPSNYFLIDTTGVADNKPMLIQTVEEFIKKQSAKKAAHSKPKAMQNAQYTSLALPQIKEADTDILDHQDENSQFQKLDLGSTSNSVADLAQHSLSQMQSNNLNIQATESNQNKVDNRGGASILDSPQVLYQIQAMNSARQNFENDRTSNTKTNTLQTEGLMNNQEQQTTDERKLNIWNSREVQQQIEAMNNARQRFSQLAPPLASANQKPRNGITRKFNPKYSQKQILISQSRIRNIQNVKDKNSMDYKKTPPKLNFNANLPVPYKDTFSNIGSITNDDLNTQISSEPLLPMQKNLNNIFLNKIQDPISLSEALPVEDNVKDFTNANVARGSYYTLKEEMKEAEREKLEGKQANQPVQMPPDPKEILKETIKDPNWDKKVTVPYGSYDRPDFLSKRNIIPRNKKRHYSNSYVLALRNNQLRHSLKRMKRKIVRKRMIRDGEEPYTNSKKKRKIDITITDGKKNTVGKCKPSSSTNRRKKYSNDVKGINKLILKFKMQHHSEAHIRSFLRRVATRIKQLRKRTNKRKQNNKDKIKNVKIVPQNVKPRTNRLKTGKILQANTTGTHKTRKRNRIEKVVKEVSPISTDKEGSTTFDLNQVTSNKKKIDTEIQTMGFDFVKTSRPVQNLENIDFISSGSGSSIVRNFATNMNENVQQNVVSNINENNENTQKVLTSNVNVTNQQANEDAKMSSNIFHTISEAFSLPIQSDTKSVNERLNTFGKSSEISKKSEIDNFSFNQPKPVSSNIFNDMDMGISVKNEKGKLQQDLTESMEYDKPTADIPLAVTPSYDKSLINEFTPTSDVTSI